MTITYHLRRGVKWHDGAPFTSRDVKFTWQAIMNPRNNVVSRRGFDQIASMDTPDDYHGRHAHEAALPARRRQHLRRERHADAHSARAPAWRDIRTSITWRSIARRSAPDPTSSSAGCAATASFCAQIPAYFGGKPTLKELTLAIIPDDNTVRAQLQSHEADLAIEMPSRSIATSATCLTSHAQLAQSPAYTAIVFNTQRPALRRRARAPRARARDGSRGDRARRHVRHGRSRRSRIYRHITGRSIPRSARLRMTRRRLGHCSTPQAGASAPTASA